MTARARFTKADVRRAVLGVAGCGQPVTSVHIHLDGRIEVLLGKPNQAHQSNEWADLE